MKVGIKGTVRPLDDVRDASSGFEVASQHFRTIFCPGMAPYRFVETARPDVSIQHGDDVHRQRLHPPLSAFVVSCGQGDGWRVMVEVEVFGKETGKSRGTKARESSNQIQVGAAFPIKPSEYPFACLRDRK
jgi:hypothetical protein